MKPFRRRRRGTVTATFVQNEAQLLVNLTGQIVELLQDRNGPAESEPDPLAQLIGMTGPVQPPEDPVLARLLPDAYRDEPDDAAEFRRFTEQSLSSAKVANARTVIQSLEDGGMDVGAKNIEVELDEAEVMAWLRALTDIRLALAVRLGIDSEDDVERLAQSDDEATLAMGEVFDWLGYVQETLVQVA